MAELYGVLEGQRRARLWYPDLTTPGQRVVFGVMLSFCGLDGRIQPTHAQIAELGAMHPNSVRRILGQLEEIGVLMRVGDRPVTSSAGIAKGGRVVVWSIANRAPESASGDTSQARPTPIPSAPYNGSKRAAKGATLKVETLNYSESSTGGVAAPFTSDICPHIPMDQDGYCTACMTQLEQVR